MIRKAERDKERWGRNSIKGEERKKGDNTKEKDSGKGMTGKKSGKRRRWKDTELAEKGRLEDIQKIATARKKEAKQKENGIKISRERTVEEPEIQKEKTLKINRKRINKDEGYREKGERMVRGELGKGRGEERVARWPGKR